MKTPAFPIRSAARLDFRTLQFFAEAVQLLEARPFQHRVQFFVYSKMLDELREAVAQPRMRHQAQGLASAYPAIAEILQDFAINAGIARREARCPELDGLLRRVMG
ncbi:MAG: hypothetical protein ABIP08_01465 [Lautropia sp.]